MAEVNVDAAAAAPLGDAGRAAHLTRLRGWLAANWANLVVFAASAVIATARMLTWPPSLRQDQFAYTLAGQVMAELQRPIQVVKLTSTTPKPLTSLLALMISPLPPLRAWAAVVVLATAVLVTAAFIYGRRVGGPLGAFIAVAGLALIHSLPPALYGGEVDLVTAAIVVLSLVAGARSRVGLMILLGLLRPLTWPLAGVAAFLAAGGSLPRRIALGIAGMVTPPLLWLLNDKILYGNALASYDANNRINKDVPPTSFFGAIDRVLTAVWTGTGPVLFVVGLCGLAVAIWRRPWKQDPFPAILFVGYVVVLVGTWMKMRYNGRYALPLVAMWPLFAAHLGSLVPIPQRLRAAALPTAVGAIAIFGLLAMHMELRKGDRNTVFNRLTLSSVPAVRRVIACGPVGVDVGVGKPQFVVQVLALEMRRPLGDFRRYNAGLRESKTQIVGPHAPDYKGHIAVLKSKGWVSRPIPLGRLWISPHCQSSS
jgi:hypothetical protein